jgi:hypothetical protein
VNLGGISLSEYGRVTISFLSNMLEKNLNCTGVIMENYQGIE